MHKKWLTIINMVNGGITVGAVLLALLALWLALGIKELKIRNQVLADQRDHAMMLFEKAMGMGGYVEREPSIVLAQVNCFRYGQVVSCDGPNRSHTTIQEFSRGQGVIITPHDTIPYTITPAPSRSTDLERQIEPLRSLEPLPSVQNSYGSREREFGTGLLPYGLDDR